MSDGKMAKEKMLAKKIGNHKLHHKYYRIQIRQGEQLHLEVGGVMVLQSRRLTVWQSARLVFC
jgi:hypothetical protein